MQTLMQQLLLTSLDPETDPILCEYIDIILPAVEREFGSMTALGGDRDRYYNILCTLKDPLAAEKARNWSDRPDQNLCVHVLNALLLGWNLAEHHLPTSLSDEEKRLFCLGITLHDYNKYCHGQGEEAPKASEIDDILALCREIGARLNFSAFWPQWETYLSDIGFLAQNTQFKCGTNTYPSNWPEFAIADSRRLTHPLRHLLGWSDIAVHLNDPADIATETAGERLQEHLNLLGIRKTLVYHRLRDSLGILTNGIHNATLHYARELGWEAIVFFARGVVYLAPKNFSSPDLADLKQFIWEQIALILSNKMLDGDVGFRRDGKGLKVAPQTSELFPPAQLIRQLSDVIAARVNNAKNPATPKRLAKLVERGLITEDREKELLKGADLRSDRLAEFIIVIQREFLGNCEDYGAWMLEALDLATIFNPEDLQINIGGVNYGWYLAAAQYFSKNGTLDLEQTTELLAEIGDRLADWATENNSLPVYSSPTREVFDRHLEYYLDFSGIKTELPPFGQELNAYAIAKTRKAKQPICSLSSGEFPSEDQLDSVVLFKPQQYSNKNTLGGSKIKRGISKIWSLEMLLRQALWSARAGKLEEQQPVFLYIFPAYVYAPQMIKAIRVLVEELKTINLWEIRKYWLNHELEVSQLSHWLWLREDAEIGRFAKGSYDSKDLPFMATVYTTTLGETVTEAWVHPAFLATILPKLLGVRVVATASNVPLYRSDREFCGSAVLDGVAGFWSLLHCPSEVRTEQLDSVLTRLLVVYTLHLDNRAHQSDARWGALNRTVREVMTDVLNIFAIAREGLRRRQHDPSPEEEEEEVERYWNFARIWSDLDKTMQEKLNFITELVRQYRTFYQVKVTDSSSHAILLPFSKVLETILSVPTQVNEEDLILQGAGFLKDAIDRQPIDTRPLMMDKSVDFATRQQQELEAIHRFVQTCVCDLFGTLYRGDRALLQENRNRLKSGAEFAYRWLALQEKNERDLASPS
jgi:CRISPR-associated protein Csc3